MDFYLRSRIEEDTKEFLGWKYEGIYSFYDNDIQKEKIDAFEKATNSDYAFTVINELNEIVGNCEFFYVNEEDEEEVLAVSIQMKPSLTGEGYGTEFFKAILEQGREHFHYNYLELMVVKFNKRAIRLYEKLGFLVKEEFENEIRGEKYRFLIMGKQMN